MAPRPPDRQKAAHIPDLVILQAVLSGSVSLPNFPAKVVSAKLRKLEKQGCVQVRAGRPKITAKGHQRILELI